MRLNRYLSQCGIGSRRGCEQIILEGRVSINGREVKDLATKVEPEDKVVVDGKQVRTETNVLLALNKPRGYICTRGDTHNRMTIYDLLPEQFQTLHHVGRLDKESEGLLLLTNRGDLSHRLTHPSMGAEKEYEVIVDKPLDSTVMAKLVKGMLTEEGHAKAERAWMDGGFRAHVVLKQGLKRQIRLMFYQLGFEVERLIRTRIGWLELRGLPKGGWKELTAAEAERFLSKDGGARPPKIVKAAKPGAAAATTKKKVSSKKAAEEPKRATKRAPRGRSEDSREERPTRGRTSTSRTERPARGRSDDSRSERPTRGRSNESRTERPFRGRGEDSKPGRPTRGKTYPPREERPFRGRGEDAGGERPTRGKSTGFKAERPSRGRLDDPKAKGDRTAKGKSQVSVPWRSKVKNVVANRDAPRRHRSGR